jgi:hypothetical protein
MSRLVAEIVRFGDGSANIYIYIYMYTDCVWKILDRSELQEALHDHIYIHPKERKDDTNGNTTKQCSTARNERTPDDLLSPRRQLARLKNESRRAHIDIRSCEFLTHTHTHTNSMEQSRTAGETTRDSCTDQISSFVLILVRAVVSTAEQRTDNEEENIPTEIGGKNKNPSRERESSGNRNGLIERVEPRLSPPLRASTELCCCKSALNARKLGKNGNAHGTAQTSGEF